MSRVLLDENLPRGVAQLIEGHEVRHVTRIGWDGLENGDLIAAAERSGFEVLVTADRNLRYQQNLTGRQLALVVLSTNRWADLRRSGEMVNDAVDRAEPGSFREVEVLPRLRGRGLE